MLVGGSVSWGKCHLGDFNLSDFLGKIFILTDIYLINATNEHSSFSKILSVMVADARKKLDLCL